MTTSASGTIDTILSVPWSAGASGLSCTLTICEPPVATTTSFELGWKPGALIWMMCGPALTSLMSSGTGPMSVPSRNARAPGVSLITRTTPVPPFIRAASSAWTFFCSFALTSTVCFHGRPGALRTSTTWTPSTTFWITVGVLSGLLFPST